MRIAICDDDEKIVESIKEHLSFYSNENSIEFEVYDFTSSVDLLSCNLKFNIAILDVEMPDCNGIQLGKKLREKNKHIILMYVTSYRKYLDEALNLSAARFFEKPLDPKRFYDGLDNALKRIDDTTINFYLKENNSSVRINADDIIYVEIEQVGHRKTKVVTEEKTYISSNNISFWDEKLVSSIFVKTHKSFIVNLSYLSKYETNCLELDGKYTIPVSRSYQTSTHKKIVKYMAGV